MKKKLWRSSFNHFLISATGRYVLEDDGPGESVQCNRKYASYNTERNEKCDEYKSTSEWNETH